MANDNVCFSAKKGEIHAICGENGAGKSTLMKLLFGVEQPNQGRIIMRGQEVKLTSPMKAIEMGIGMVYQHFMLVSSLTVAENMMLGIEPKRGIRFDRDKAVARTRTICEKYKFEIDPLAKIEDLSKNINTSKSISAIFNEKYSVIDSKIPLLRKIGRGIFVSIAHFCFILRCGTMYLQRRILL